MKLSRYAQDMQIVENNSGRNQEGEQVNIDELKSICRQYVSQMDPSLSQEQRESLLEKYLKEKFNIEMTKELAPVKEKFNIEMTKELAPVPLPNEIIDSPSTELSMSRQQKANGVEQSDWVKEIGIAAIVIGGGIALLRFLMKK